ncbi:zinc dependent phospholipase C family protein [Vulgatibacter sp.]|uniref:zinc dependent phospholipase C family protein n=1 Tax=Vulgatibacter sp. TaxID=1971226 RepID=UPI003561F2CD
MKKAPYALFLPVLGFLSLLLWPDDAHAWGPLSHLDFSTGALGQVSLLPAALRVLLAKCADDFLYGSLAADIIVGKNLARYAVHCHNWKVGWKVFDKAKGEPQQAFALGFLSHLAADTVAHNYYVPYKTVEGFPVRATGHAYWELRYDQKLDPKLWQTARRITAQSFRKHDEFLEEALCDSYVIPFGVSKRMFNQLLFAARMKKYQAMCAVVAAEKDHLPLTDEEVAETRQLAVSQILSMLAEGEKGRANDADPTGGRNLHFAVKLRQQLREASRRNELAPDDATEVLRQTRPAFREAIFGKLVLPEIPLRSEVSAAARAAVELAAEDTEGTSAAQIEAENIAREADDLP